MKQAWRSGPRGGRGVAFSASESEDECVGNRQVGEAELGGGPTNEGKDQGQREEQM